MDGVGHFSTIWGKNDIDKKIKYIVPYDTMVKSGLNEEKTP